MSEAAAEFAAAAGGLTHSRRRTREEGREGLPPPATVGPVPAGRAPGADVFTSAPPPEEPKEEEDAGGAVLPPAMDGAADPTRLPRVDTPLGTTEEATTCVAALPRGPSTSISSSPSDSPTFDSSSPSLPPVSLCSTTLGW